MKYLGLAYFTPENFDEMSPDDVKALVSQCPALDEQMQATGKMLVSASLGDLDKWKTLRPRRQDADHRRPLHGVEGGRRRPVHHRGGQSRRGAAHRLDAPGRPDRRSGRLGRRAHSDGLLSFPLSLREGPAPRRTAVRLRLPIGIGCGVPRIGAGRHLRREHRVGLVLRRGGAPYAPVARHPQHRHLHRAGADRAARRGDARRRVELLRRTDPGPGCPGVHGLAGSGRVSPGVRALGYGDRRPCGRGPRWRIGVLSSTCRHQRKSSSTPSTSTIGV